jgi:hypothetical protein
MEYVNFYWRKKASACSTGVFSFVSQFFPQNHYSYLSALDHLKSRSLYSRRRLLDALVLVHVKVVLNSVLSWLDTVAVPFRNFRDFPLFTAVSLIKLAPLKDVHQPQMCRYIRETTGCI